MEFPAIPEDLSALSDSELDELHSELVAAFNEATPEGATLTDEDVATLTGVTDSIETLRNEKSARGEAASARAATLAELASRVNATDAAEGEGDEEGEEGDGESEQTEGEGTEEETTTEEQTEEVSQPDAPVTELPATETETPAPQAVAATGTKKAVTAGATVAQLKRHAPIKTRPREAPRSNVSITAAVDVPGHRAGQPLDDLRAVAVAMCERFRTIGQGNGDAVQVARFNANLPEDRHLTRDMSPDQIARRIEAFDRTPQGIVAAGGLCAPVNSYYDQMIVADAARPVRDSLANFQADRGGIRYNPPPKLSSLTSGVGTVTAAQDASNATKTAFAVTCSAITEVDITAIYTSLLFGNIGARAYPEYVEGWIKLGLAAAARKAETVLLDGISAASTQVTTAGLVGAGREVFARLGQVAAAYRSRNRMRDVPLRVLLPAWTLDLVQADFARTFTDETGLISMTDADITALFGARDLNVSWYLDSKTGGGQVFGAAAGGQTYTDAATTSGSATLTSSTATFTAADVGKTITGAGIPAATTISAVGSGTSITLSANATATATGVTITVGRTTAAQFPTTVDAFLFPEGSFLHLDAGTLDLGLVRDSSLNSTNQFQMFSETFENVALVGPESIEVILSLSPDGSYAAAKSVTSPINS